LGDRIEITIIPEKVVCSSFNIVYFSNSLSLGWFLNLLCAGEQRVFISIVVYEAFHSMASNPELSDCGHGKQNVQPLDPSDGARITNQLRTQRAGQNTVLNQYERLKRIGTGQHGEVYVAWDMTTASFVVSVLCDSPRIMTSFIYYPGYQGDEAKKSQGR
jgi:hypothetical protein